MKRKKITRPAIVKLPNLTPSEELILEFLNTYTKDTFLLSQKELAQITHTSEPTISRFIKKYGYKSYKEFQVYFNKKLIALNTKFIVRDIEGNKGQLQNMLTSHKYGIENTINPQIMVQLEDLAEQVKKADRVICFGRGSQEVTASQLNKNLQRIGINSLQPNSFHNMLPLIGGSSEGDLFIIFSNLLRSKEVIFAMRELYDKNNKVIIITSHQTKTYDNYLYMRIKYDKIHNNNFYVPVASKISQIIICDLLFEIILESDVKYKTKLKESMSIFSKWNLQAW